jgi:hypothetical protein
MVSSRWGVVIATIAAMGSGCFVDDVYTSPCVERGHAQQADQGDQTPVVVELACDETVAHVDYWVLYVEEIPRPEDLVADPAVDGMITLRGLISSDLTTPATRPARVAAGSAAGDYNIVASFDWTFGTVTP